MRQVQKPVQQHGRVHFDSTSPGDSHELPTLGQHELQISGADGFGNLGGESKIPRHPWLDQFVDSSGCVEAVLRTSMIQIRCLMKQL